VAERNRAAVGVHMRGVVLEGQLAQARERLRGKCFIEGSIQSKRRS
jgi:hypothetical protein